MRRTRPTQSSPRQLPPSMRRRAGARFCPEVPYEAEAREAETHHRPSRRFRSADERACSGLRGFLS